MELEKSPEDSPAIKHIQVDEPWLYCQVSSHKCKDKKSIKNHQKTKHNKIKFCEKCSESFPSKEALETHVINVHKIQPAEHVSEGLQSKVCGL